MKIAVIGAGFAGLSSAKVLTEMGHQVTVYEKAPDVGGVWSATRRYPGLRTQNSKETYTLSGLRFPGHVHQWAPGEDVQRYMEEYVKKFNLAPMLRLSTEVTHAAPADAGGWDVTTAQGSEHYDHLVVASGIFSRPAVPEYEGRELFERLGGRIMPPSEWHHPDEVRGKDVLVIGYGKSSCDAAVEIAKVAKSTTVVARHLLWKMPRKIKGIVNYKYLMLTRLGEGLFPYRRTEGFARVLHANNSAIANNMVGSLEKVTTAQLKLKEHGVLPEGTFADIARSTVSLATEGFFEGIEDGSIRVKRDNEIVRFLEKDGKPHAELRSGDVVPCDVVIAGTGWSQEIPFFPQEVLDQLFDENGDYLLYRQIFPINLKDLTFAGYNSSFFSPLSAEVSAIWIASYLGGNHRTPSREAMLTETRARLKWMRERTRGHHARGTNLIPFSMHNIDEVLSDVGIDVSNFTKFKQWLMPPSPQDYAGISTELARRIAARA
ncbi:MAG: NAD(P)/FAD-dependent oxidoreductase [Comamonadaceae bacterium]|nr:NAD(P)/FAD-dependent oxidoreductase [Burkholderiales bacterium]MEB2349258.1 NAD(P)/FAD-dependent oxidoreductase [Comamonadaceae bacterium]